MTFDAVFISYQKYADKNRKDHKHLKQEHASETHVFRC